VCRRAIKTNAPVVLAAPMIIESFEPNRSSSRPESGPAMLITSAIGSMYRPAWVTLAPNPNPVDLGTWIRFGINRNELNIP
jgi:hypothetical protein